MPLMKTLSGQTGPAMNEPAVARFYTRRDVIIIVLLTAAVIAISAHAPSNTYAYAQRWQAGASIGVAQGGNWLLPRNQAWGLARKGPLYAWLDAPVLMLTGIYDDFTFRLPTVAAALATALCVYVLGRWWYGRRVALLAACLWIAAHHMVRLAYLGTTDMLLTLWITCSIMCVDRLVFHPAARRNRKWWACGLWVSMILGALTKGWGVVNLPLVAGMTALAAALGPGFEAHAAARRPGNAILLIMRLILRRWWNAIKAIRLWWGLPAFAAVTALMVWGMFAVGGKDFRELVYFEVIQRATGRGEHPPVSPSAPAILTLMYYALPASFFALGGLLLVRPSAWLTRKGPIYLPLCWVIAVVVPFSMAHGFRPDYLLPCYAPVALMGAWAVDNLARRQGRGGTLLPVLRHAFAAPAVIIGEGLVVIASAYLLHRHLPPSLAKLLPVPAEVRGESWWILGSVIVLGLGVVAWAIRSSLRWKLGQVAFAACVGMVGVMFVYSHFVSRHARTGDGEKMRRFAQRTRKIVGDDKVATFWTDSLCVRVYLGRLGPLLARPGAPKARPIEMYLEELVPGGVPWLITCDRGLVEMGQSRELADGNYKVKVDGRVRTFQTLPELLSDGPVVHSEPILARYWGRLYLIRLKADARPYGKPKSLPWIRRDARKVEDVFQAARAALR